MLVLFLCCFLKSISCSLNIIIWRERLINLRERYDSLRERLVILRPRYNMSEAILMSTYNVCFKISCGYPVLNAQLPCFYGTSSDKPWMIAIYCIRNVILIRHNEVSLLTIWKGDSKHRACCERDTQPHSVTSFWVWLNGVEFVRALYQLMRKG